MNDAPDGYEVQRVLAIWHEARQKLLDADLTLYGDEAALAELLGPAQVDVDEAITRALRAKVHAEAMAAAADEQAKMIFARRKRYQMREDRFKQLAVDLMVATNRKKFEIANLTASVIAGRVGVDIPNPELVEDKYCEIVTVRKPDREVIKADLEAGAPVRGAELKVGDPFLMIRRG